MPTEPLGIGFVGSGFNTRFHLQAFTAVRDAEIRGIWSPNARNAEAARALLRYLTGPEAAEAMKAHALEPIAR